MTTSSPHDPDLADFLRGAFLEDLPAGFFVDESPAAFIKAVHVLVDALNDQRARLVAVSRLAVVLGGDAVAVAQLAGLSDMELRNPRP